AARLKASVLLFFHCSNIDVLADFLTTKHQHLTSLHCSWIAPDCSILLDSEQWKVPAPSANDRFESRRTRLQRGFIAARQTNSVMSTGNVSDRRSRPTSYTIGDYEASTSDWIELHCTGVCRCS